MAFCANCGAPVEGRFCAKCGAPVGAAAPPPGTPPVSSATPVPPPPPVAQSTPLAENVASALCYVLLLITGILFLVLEPYNKNRTIRFHAFQAIFLAVALILARIVLGILFAIVGGFAGGFFIFAIAELFGLACLVLVVFMIVTAYQGKKIVLPVIGPLAEQQA